MRVLTDPVEIRAFRKRQIRKILKMAKSEISRGTCKVWHFMRASLINVSFCAGLIAIWVFAIALLVWSCNVFLEFCTVNW